MPTTYTASFNRSGTLTGPTETGGGTWQNVGGAGSLDGARVYLASAAQFAYLDIGYGDVDVTAQLEYGLGAVVVRADATTQRRWRARLYSVSTSGGYYQTVTNYTAQYNFQCNNQSSFIYSSNCGSNSFPSSVTAFCNGSPVSAGLFQSYANGTCEQYVSTSSTNYYVVLERLDAAGAVTALHTMGCGSAPTVRLSAQGSVVRLYLDGTLQHTATDADPASRAAGRHGLAGQGYATSFSLTVLNTAPDAPLLLSPVGNAVVNRAEPVVLDWQFSDTDATDTQSAYELELTGPGGVVATYAEATPTTQRTLPAGSLAAGSYSWRVRTKDAQGLEGPWSETAYFSAASPPPSPTLTAPMPGATIPTEAFTVTWSAPEQDAYQVRRTADVADPTPAQVHQDTGVVAAPAARSVVLSFPVNQRAERVWVRVRARGILTAWVAAPVVVDYAPPAKPVVALTPVSTLDDEYLVGTTDAIQVAITNPTPTGPQPVVLFNEVYIDDDDGAGESRRAGGLPNGGSFLYCLPRATVDYTPLIRVVALAANGTSASSR